MLLVRRGVRLRLKKKVDFHGERFEQDRSYLKGTPVTIWYTVRDLPQLRYSNVVVVRTDQKEYFDVLLSDLEPFDDA